MGTKINPRVNFCLDCGTYLPPRSGRDLRTVCLRCNMRTPALHKYPPRQPRRSVIMFNSATSVPEQEVMPEVVVGPKVDRKCQVCGHEEMTYTTRQTRSADEGQTIFYCCIKCKATEVEYS